MTKIRPCAIHWLPDAQEHDYPAAGSYLALLFPADRVTALVERLKAQPIVPFKAKDIFRAARLSLLGVSNSHVERDWKKIKKGQTLSPLLLVRDETSGRVVIADGYHRLCAVYGLDEDAVIPCKII
jgi:hypothetical protein